MIITPTDFAARCHDCGETEDLEFVSWIDHYLCPDCLEAELG